MRGPILVLAVVWGYGCSSEPTTADDDARRGESLADAALLDGGRSDASRDDILIEDATPHDATPQDASLFDAAPADANANPMGTLIENFSPPGGGLLWTCPDGTEIALSSEVSKQSTICLGIDGSDCHEPGVDPGPGDPLCDNPNFNGFAGTCVETYFSCFEPAGTCTVLGNGDQSWANGALQDRNSPNVLLTYIPPGEAQPCITGILGDGIVTYDHQ